MDFIRYHGRFLGRASAFRLRICDKAGTRFVWRVDRNGIGYDNTMHFGRTEVQVWTLEVRESLTDMDLRLI